MSVLERVYALYRRPKPWHRVPPKSWRTRGIHCTELKAMWKIWTTNRYVNECFVCLGTLMTTWTHFPGCSQDRAHYHLKRMNGVWSRIGSWFKGGPKKPESSQQTTHEGVQPSRLRSTDSRRTRSTESRERRSNDDYEHSNTEVGQMLSSQDRYLEEIEGSVDNLAQRGKGIRDEIEYQNQVVDDVGCKIDNVERRMEKNTKEARRLMR
eukprot:gb/GECG01010565.1/.p1 GENE.gb/GECG01010565.1/~~gb/GECG01010565.1/.p1  ORF type:complete len:209 (+),score=18.12 gb/GECG01010565.1/:1-627(+)